MEPLRVLIIEDEEQDAELVRIELERGGFELEWERVDTEPALRRMLGEREWDLIISDFAMPGFDGLKAFDIYRSWNLDIPFIFVSGALGEERAVAAMRAGARDYFLKGEFARLNAAVRRELAEASSRRARRSMEEMAEQEKRRLAVAVDASGAGVYEHRYPADVRNYYSERWAQIFGRSEEWEPPTDDLLSWMFEQVHPDDVAVVRDAYQEFLDGASDRYSAEFRIRHASGDWIDVALFAKAAERDSDGRAIHAVGVLLDLTEQRRLEAQLRQAQKMEAVGRLAGGVAHDFNNLLTVIMSFGTFVIDALDEGGPAYEDMQELLKAAQKAESLTEQLLAFSRRKPISPKTININQLVVDVERMLRRVVGEDIDVSTVLATNLWNVRMDQGSLEQVIVNLVVNARDAMHEGGNLTIETGNVELGEDYGRAHGAQIPAAEYVVLAISDDGVGMDQDVQRRIFEPFYTTKESGRGTGLGLSTCYGIVKQAGGYIWVYSEIGKGTTFKVYLPRITDAAERLEPKPSPTNLRGNETILVAEDDDQVRRLLVRVLSDAGYQVIESSRGGEALEKSASYGEPIDLLVTDVVMPEMSGRQLAEALGPSRPDMRVLYVSGYTPNSIIHRGVLDPGARLLQKPFTPDVLARRVREVLDE